MEEQTPDKEDEYNDMEDYLIFVTDTQATLLKGSGQPVKQHYLCLSLLAYYYILLSLLSLNLSNGLANKAKELSVVTLKEPD